MNGRRQRQNCPYIYLIPAWYRVSGYPGIRLPYPIFKKEQIRHRHHHHIIISSSLAGPPPSFRRRVDPAALPWRDRHRPSGPVSTRPPFLGGVATVLPPPPTHVLPPPPRVDPCRPVPAGTVSTRPSFLGGAATVLPAPYRPGRPSLTGPPPSCRRRRRTSSTRSHFLGPPPIYRPRVDPVALPWQDRHRPTGPVSTRPHVLPPSPTHVLPPPGTVSTRPPTANPPFTQVACHFFATRNARPRKILPRHAALAKPSL